jgi:hypothetical protein
VAADLEVDDAEEGVVVRRFLHHTRGPGGEVVLPLFALEPVQTHQLQQGGAASLLHTETAANHHGYRPWQIAGQACQPFQLNLLLFSKFTDLINKRASLKEFLRQIEKITWPCLEKRRPPPNPQKITLHARKPVGTEAGSKGHEDLKCTKRSMSKWPTS